MANTKKAPGKERSTAEVEAAVKEMETQSVKDSTKEAAAGEKDSAKKNTVKKGSMKKAAAYAEETELGANAADKAEEDTTEVKPKLTGKLDEKMIASCLLPPLSRPAKNCATCSSKGAKKESSTLPSFLKCWTIWIWKATRWTASTIPSNCWASIRPATIICPNPLMTRIRPWRRSQKSKRKNWSTQYTGG